MVRQSPLGYAAIDLLGTPWCTKAGHQVGWSVFLIRVLTLSLVPTTGHTPLLPCLPLLNGSATP